MKNRKKRRPASERSTLVEQWRVSGKSQREFCREHGVNSSTFAGWVRTPKAARLGAKTATAARPPALVTSFSEVRVVDDPSRRKPAVVEVTTPSGYVLRLTGQVAPSMLREFLDEVSQC